MIGSNTTTGGGPGANLDAAATKRRENERRKREKESAKADRRQDETEPHVRWPLIPAGTSAPVPPVTVAMPLRPLGELYPLFILLSCSSLLPSLPSLFILFHFLRYILLRAYCIAFLWAQFLVLSIILLHLTSLLHLQSVSSGHRTWSEASLPPFSLFHLRIPAGGPEQSIIYYHGYSYCVHTGENSPWDLFEQNCWRPHAPHTLAAYASRKHDVEPLLSVHASLPARRHQQRSQPACLRRKLVLPVCQVHAQAFQSNLPRVSQV